VNGFVNVVYGVSHRVIRVVYINLLWFTFTLLGLILFGFFPATFAMFAVVRSETISERQDKSIFKLYWKAYVEYFVKINIIGWLYVLILFVLLLEIDFISEYNNNFLNVFLVPLLTLIVILCCTLLFIFPFHVHYRGGILDSFKVSFLTMLLNPILTFSMLFAILIVFLINLYIPISAVFFSGSVYAFIIMNVSLIGFKKIERRNGIQK